MPFTGSGYKKVVLIFDLYIPASTSETFNFPSNFTGYFNVSANPNNLQYDLSGSALTITNFSTSTTYNMIMIVEGW